MKINPNQSVNYNTIPTDQPIELKEGETYLARIKERLSDNEAIIQVKGKEVRATFEGKVPNNDRVSVQVNENGEKSVLVKAVPDQTQPSNQDAEITGTSRQTSSSDANGLNQAVKILQDNGISLDKESFQQLKKFMDSSSGTLQQKLETLQALANKKMDVTTTHLQSIHEALHGTSVADILRNPTSTGRGEGKTGDVDRDNIAIAIQQIKELIAKVGSDPRKILQTLQSLSEGKGTQLGGAVSPALQETVAKLLASLQKRSLTSGQDQSRASGQELLMKTLGEMMKPTASSASTNSTLVSIKQALQQEQSLEKTLQQIKTILANSPPAEKELLTGVEKVLAEGGKFATIGWDGLGRERIQNAISQVETNLQATTSDMDKTGLEQMLQQIGDSYDEWQMGTMLPSKDIVITEITKRLSEAAIQFKNTKREMVRNMDHIIQFAQNNRTNVMPVVKPLLENTIDLLDKAILKSDITMLTDMETEKELMQASTQLAEARKHLAKGQNSEAVAVLQEVKGKLESMNWRPSNVRVQHFLTGNSLFMEETPSIHQLSSKMAEATAHFQQQEPSARKMYEFMRSMGLNHESEVAQRLSALRDGSAPVDIHQNLKTALLQLAKTEGDQAQGHHVQPQVEQALNNLTGQQLLSKSESGSNLQSMFFNLPLMLGGKLENVKMYLNSKNEGEKIDWENCSLYFMIETKKLGQTGILLSAVDRNLSITVKNDNPQFKEKMEPVVSKCKESLKELGYNISGIKFTPLLAENKEDLAAAQPSTEKTASRPPQANSPAKGFDFKI